MKHFKVTTSSIILIILVSFTFVFIHWDFSIITGTSLWQTILQSRASNNQPLDFKCSDTCPGYIYQVPKKQLYDKSSSVQECPEYFRWIHEDLKPWKENGISKDKLEAAEKHAHLRIVILKGRLYVKQLKKAYQSRDVFTIWGILQLLRLYPGYLPDLDIAFDCGDKPVVRKIHYLGKKRTTIPPLFHYCGSITTWDIPFPDWSFWGWPEVRINPWETLRKDLEQGNGNVEWTKREPYAYWKGNPRVSPTRNKLLECNISKDYDWGAYIYDLNWAEEKNNTFKSSDLASQCTHRYKIYVEGAAWSVSEKYILACNSMSLVITPHYHDFFTRSLIPTVHYWPINEADMCRSIKFAVNWGNKHLNKAQEIGKKGSDFIQEELKMKHVYDYMFHLLYSYGELLRYEPSVPEGSVEVCLETLACTGNKLRKRYKLKSMVMGPSNTTIPCSMPSPYDFESLHNFIQKKEKLIEDVESLEQGRQ